jgi:hypothetical protein
MILSFIVIRHRFPKASLNFSSCVISHVEKFKLNLTQAYKNERVVSDLRDRISKFLLLYWDIGRKAVAILN